MSIFAMVFFIFVVGILVLAGYRLAFLRVTIWQHEAGLLYRNGQLDRVLGPGRYRIFRLDQEIRVSRYDLRLRTMALKGQEILTADNVGLKLNASLIYKLEDPAKAEAGAVMVDQVIYQQAQLALRTAVSRLPVEEALEKRGQIEAEAREALTPLLAALGVGLTTLGVTDIMFPGELKHIFNEVIKARKEGQAALEKARGESAALRNLANAAHLLEQSPGLMNLRVLQAISASMGNTYVMGLSQGLLDPGKGK